MVKHVVLFKLHEKNRAAELRDLLLTMQGKVPQIQKIEVGLNFTERDSAYDVCLIVEVLQPQDIPGYLSHPYHLEVVTKIKMLCSHLCAVDY